MTTPPKNVLAVIAPHVGGRAAGAGLATFFPGEANVTVVEAADENRDALREHMCSSPRLPR